jgi:hypothetical protein
VVDAQFLLAMDFGLFDMHIKTERAPIDLGRSYVYKIDQSVSQRALLHRTGKLKKYFCQVGRLLKKIQTLAHSVSFQAA